MENGMDKSVDGRERADVDADRVRGLVDDVTAWREGEGSVGDAFICLIPRF